MCVRFLCMSLIALSVNVASSSLAYTPLNLRVSAPVLTETLREHLRTTWPTPVTRWSLWGEMTYTNLQVEESEVVTEVIVQNLSNGQSAPGQIDMDLKEELEVTTLWGGIDLHLGRNVLVGLLSSYQTSISTQTFGESSIDTSLAPPPGTPPGTPFLPTLPTFMDNDTTESFGGGAYLGWRFQTLTLHTAIAAWIGEIEENAIVEYDTRDLFLSVALNQDFTVADDFLSLGWHLSGVWSSRDYGDEFKFENKNSFTRGEAGIRIGLHSSQSEIFALASVNYDTFSDEQSLRYENIFAFLGNNLLAEFSEDKFSFVEERFGMNIGGGLEVGFTDGLELHLLGQYSDIFRDSYEGYSGIVHLSYTWREDLSLSSGVSAREEESIWGIRLEHAL